MTSQIHGYTYDENPTVSVDRRRRRRAVQGRRHSRTTDRRHPRPLVRLRRLESASRGVVQRREWRTRWRLSRRGAAAIRPVDPRLVQPPVGSAVAQLPARGRPTTRRHDGRYRRRGIRSNPRAAALPHRVHLADHGDDPTISRQRRHRRIGCRRHARRLVQGRHLDGHVMVTAL